MQYSYRMGEPRTECLHYLQRYDWISRWGEEHINRHVDCLERACGTQLRKTVTGVAALVSKFRFYRHGV